jgi:hypothetical protein
VNILNNFAQKIGIGISTAAILAASFIVPAMAASVTYTPWTFIGAAGDCGTGYPAGTPNGAKAQQNSDGSVTLTKTAPTPDCSSAGVSLNNVNGTNVTSLSFDYTGYCGAGAPRFNVYTTSGVLFFGCTYGDPTSTGTATFTAGNTYGGVEFPSGGVTVTGIEIVQDETGNVTISDITVNGNTVTYANTPSAKDQCKNNGYKDLTDLNGHGFKNQGQCVSYFEHQSHMTH